MTDTRERFLTNKQLILASFSVQFERKQGCNPACPVYMLGLEVEVYGTASYQRVTDQTNA